jgi:hypothetical protein
VKGPVDVGCKVDFRTLDGRSYAGSRSEMRDRVGSFCGKCAQDGVFVSNIDCVETNIGENRLQIFSFDPGIVEVVEIINDRDRVPIGQEGLDQVRTDKSATSRDQYFHIATRSKLGGNGKERKE